MPLTYTKSLVQAAYRTLSGRNPVCPFRDAARGLRRSRALADLAGRLASEISRQTTDAALVLWRTPFGDFWSPDSANPHTVALVLAEQEMASYGEVRKDDLILDCGANIGAFTVHALRNGAERVLAFEPAPDTRECLRRNTESFGSRVSICPKGVWDEDAELTFLKDVRNSGGSSFITRNEGAVEAGALPVTTLAKAVDDYGFTRVSFIKMDIEAAEIRALKGGKSVLATQRPRLAVAVEHTPDRTANALGVIAAVKDACPGYRVSADICYLTREGLLLPEILRFS